MLVLGHWETDQGGATQPVLRVRLRDAAGALVTIPVLIDTGAETTVFDYRVLEALGFEYPPAGFTLTGLGGETDAVLVPGPLMLVTSAGPAVPVNGSFAGCPDPTGLDSSVLGRDVLMNFAVIFDKPGETIVIVADPHRYSIHAS